MPSHPERVRRNYDDAPSVCELCGTSLRTGQHGVYEMNPFSGNITVCRNTLIVMNPRRLGVVTGITTDGLNE